ncbi:DUF6259 domain-containing protein [bacterium]|nr:DUF6259 domain-containing protein [bacterium]
MHRALLTTNAMNFRFPYLLFAVIATLTFGHLEIADAQRRTPLRRQGVRVDRIDPIDLKKASDNSSLYCYESGAEIFVGKIKRLRTRRRTRSFFFRLADLHRTRLRFQRKRLQSRNISRRRLRKRMQRRRARLQEQRRAAHTLCSNTLSRDPGLCSTEIETENLKLALEGDEEYGVRISSLSVRDRQGQFIPFSPASYPLWQIGMIAAGEDEPAEYLIPEGREQIVRCIPDPSSQQVELRWEGVQSGRSPARFTVSLTVTAHPTNGGIEFLGRTITESPSSTRGIGQFRFPQLVIENTDSSSVLLKGIMGGIAIEDPARNAREEDEDGSRRALRGTYPREQTVAVDALSREDRAALVLATNDSRENHLALHDFIAGGTGDGVLLAVERTPEDPFFLHDIPEAGRVVLGGVPLQNTGKDLFYDIAQWYRAHGSTHSSRPDLHSESAPRSQRELLLTTLIGSDLRRGRQFGENITYLDEMLDFLQISGEQLQVIWYDWHGNEFDTNLPEHWPPHESFEPHHVAELRALGITGISGYINPIYWDVHSPNYVDLDVESRGAFQNSDGSLQRGELGSSIDPASPVGYDWSLNNSLRPLVEDYRMTSAYYDVYPWTHRCYADHHGHPVGGGSSTWEASLRFLRESRELLQQEHGSNHSPYLLTEGAPDVILEEPYFGTANHYRAINFKNLKNNSAFAVPFFDALYRQQVPMASNLIIDIPGATCDLSACYQEAKDLFRDTGESERLKLALDLQLQRMMESFRWGHLPILVHRPVPDRTTNVTALKDDPLLEAIPLALKGYIALLNHEEIRPFLHGGDFARPLKGVQTRYSALSKANQLFTEDPSRYPHVLTHAFTNGDGKVALMLGNWTANQEEVRLPTNYTDSKRELTLSELFLPHPRENRIERQILVQQNETERSVTVPPRSTMLVVYR